MARLNGKVAVITGGSSGIGLATAKRFVEEGAYVFITGRRAGELEKAKKVIGRNVTTVQGDVANLADLDHLYETIKAEKGGVDIVVANAGFVEPVPFGDATPEHFDETFSINVRGTYFTVQKVLPLMRSNGSVVLVSSSVANMGLPGYSTYGASKAAIRSFARTWAAELKERGIRVNTLSPGGTDTPIIDERFKTPEAIAGAKKMLAELAPPGRIGRPEEIADAAFFLASDQSGFATASNSWSMAA